nr:hypothetical protein [Tanacetum cinerariifolium]
MASNPENIRLSILAKLQEALDEEDILADQILTMMHRYADRFTNRRDEINNLMVLQDHPLVDYGKYALGCMRGADMKKVRDSARSTNKKGTRILKRVSMRLINRANDWLGIPCSKKCTCCKLTGWKGIIRWQGRSVRGQLWYY